MAKRITKAYRIMKILYLNNSPMLAYEIWKRVDFKLKSIRDLLTWLMSQKLVRIGERMPGYTRAPYGYIKYELTTNGTKYIRQRIQREKLEKLNTSKTEYAN